MFRVREAALPVLIALVYLNASAVLVRRFDVPSVLQLVIVVLATVAVLEMRAGGIADILLQPLTYLLACYVAVLLLTTTFARNVTLADERVVDTLKALGIYVLVVALGSSFSRLRYAAYTLAGSAALLSALALFQTVTGTYGRWYGGFARVKNAHIYDDVFQPRIAGPLGDPNFFAQILLMAIPVALFIGWESSRARVRLAAFCAAGVIGAATLLTYSRGGMLALAVVLMLALVAHRVDQRRLLGGLAALVLLLLILPPSFTRRFVTISEILPGSEDTLRPDASFQKRRLLTASAWKMFKDNPLLGVGAGNYTVWFDHYAEQVGSEAREYDDPGERHYAHNLYLEIAAEAGMAGLLIFGAAVALALAQLRSAWRELLRQGEREMAGLAKAFELALIGYLICGLFLHGHFQRYLWLLLAFATALARLTAPAREARQLEPALETP